MALVRLDLTIATTINEACDTMTLADTTGEYPAAANGYASPDAIIHDDVLTLTIVVRNKSTGTYFTYAFGILLQVTQTTTLSLNGGTATNIHTEVGPLAFPFITDVNEFDLWADYGVTLPDFDDAVYQIEYTITGQSTGGGGSPLTDFSYTTSVAVLKDCDTCCCISGKFAALDPNCNCSSAALDLAIQADTWLKTARAAAAMGDVTKAVAALTKADETCNCSDCADC